MLLTSGANAAITITVTPGVTGTCFSIIQTAANPLVALDHSTVGFNYGLGLAPQASTQAPGLRNFTGTFGASLGTMVDLVGGGSALVNGLSFYHHAASGLYYPGLNYSLPFELGPGTSHQFAFTDGVEREMAGLAYENFVVGTYIRSDAIFGSITTVVVPEPAAGVLGLLSLAVFFRRRR